MPRTIHLFVRRGFSILEVLTAVAVIAVIAAVILSNQNPETANDRLRYRTAADELLNLSQAVAGFNAIKTPRSFHQVVGVYPGKLSDLTTKITTAGTNICGGNYVGPVSTAGTNLYNWDKAPYPFYGRQLLTTGTPIAPGFIVEDALVRLNTVITSGAGVNGSNTIIIQMKNVAMVDATGLDLAVDGVVDGTSGTVRYTVTTDPTPTTVEYYIPVSITTAAC